VIRAFDHATRHLTDGQVYTLIITILAAATWITWQAWLAVQRQLLERRRVRIIDAGARHPASPPSHVRINP
jgi:hypothetical protein